VKEKGLIDRSNTINIKRKRSKVKVADLKNEAEERRD